VPSVQDFEQVAAFDRWRVDAREHPGGLKVSERLGNVATIAFLRETLDRQAADFPILVQRVLYSGSHTGDVIGVALFDALEGELRRIPDVRQADAQGEHLLQFRERFGAVVRAARDPGKPIVF
jgi:hypothetical protein